MGHRGFIGTTCLLAAAALLAPFFAAGQANVGASARSARPAGQISPAARADRWPKKIRLGEGTLSIEEPEARSLDGTKLTAVSSAKVEREGEGNPSFGTVSFEADVEIDRAARIVKLASVRVSKVEFDGMPPARRDRIGDRISQTFARMQPTMPLDALLAGLRLTRSRDAAPPALNTDPPKILFETEPAILVVFDGEPRFRAVEGSRLERALNTPFLVLRVPGSNVCYLDGGSTWFRAPDPSGPWTEAEDVPSAALQVASRDLKDAGVADAEVKQARASADKRVPKILVATEPTELVVTDGPPRWSPVVPGALESVSNSEGDVFRTVSDGRYWIVLSGRWYRSPSLAGPWAYVAADRLPESFRRIPSDSPQADALAFVPGTGPAREALVDATKPRTAAIRRADAHLEVTYDGEPRFEALPGTHVEYAVNTPDQVLKIRGRYFACDQGVWFTASDPTGPWTVADKIPEDDIQAIPPSSPVYNTRFAYVYDATPELVYTAYTPAYLGSYPYDGAVVFGTGFYYRPWWGSFYYPRPWTWGFHARYALWSGWGYGFGWGPAWGGFRYALGYGWGARWMGPGGFYRPAFRNVNVTRNVTVNRSTAQRSLYASGTNRARAVAQNGAASAGRGQKQAASKTTGTRSPRAGQSGGTRKPGAGASRGKSAKPPRGPAGGRHGAGGRKRN